MKKAQAAALAASVLASSVAFAANSDPDSPAPQIIRGQFTISTFKVPDYSTMAAQHINDNGAIVGSYDTNSGATTVGFARSPNGSLMTLQNPLNTSNTFTAAYDITDEDRIVGEYFDDANDQYSGFLYDQGVYSTYNVPGLPAQSGTGLYCINTLNTYGGTYEALGATQALGFITVSGAVTTIQPDSTAPSTEVESINAAGQLAGTYSDGSQFHGFIRSRAGTYEIIDVPGTQIGPGPYSGTVLIGLNNAGWTSGHYWDSSGFEHGFVRSPHGVFYEINVPGAVDNVMGEGTGGGGLNKSCTVSGHYDVASGGPQAGFIATAKFSCD